MLRSTHPASSLANGFLAVDFFDSSWHLDRILLLSIDRVAQELSFLLILEKVLFGGCPENEVDSLLAVYVVFEVLLDLPVRSLAFVALVLIGSADPASPVFQTRAVFCKWVSLRSDHPNLFLMAFACEMPFLAALDACPSVEPFLLFLVQGSLPYRGFAFILELSLSFGSDSIQFHWFSVFEVFFGVVPARCFGGFSPFLGLSLS